VPGANGLAYLGDEGKKSFMTLTAGRQLEPHPLFYIENQGPVL